MHTLKYILLFGLGFSIYCYLIDDNEKQKESKKLEFAFSDNVKNCNYSPFTKKHPSYFKGTVGYLIANNLDNEKDFDALQYFLFRREEIMYNAIFSG